ncbi:MAG: hypothetical protein P8178_17905 [Candidatus Thiodiazotropha sp.]
MRTAYNKTLFLIASISTLTLSACGGGGGSTNLGINVPTTGVSLTTTNARPVGATVLGSVDTVQGASSGVSALTGVSINNQPGHFNYADFIVRELSQAVASDALPGGNATGVAVQTTLDCLTSGTVSVSGDVADPNTLTAGDSLTFSFNNCNVDGYVTNGGMDLSVSYVTPNFTGIEPFTLDVDVVLHSLSVNDSGSSYSANGDMSLLIDVDSVGNESVRLSGSSLATTASTESTLLSNYQYDMNYATNADFSVSLQGTVASTKIDGAVSFTTLTNFTGNDNVYGGYPTAGELHITTTADSSQAWVIALSDGTNVQIDLDTNGDDTVDSTVMTTWTELESL